MLKFNGALIATGVAMVAVVTILAGLGVRSTAGAATDVIVIPTWATSSPTMAPTAIPTATPTQPGLPPASGNEPPAGGPGGGSNGPASLPSTGSGRLAAGHVGTILLAAFGVLGVALIGVGATATARRK